MGIEDAEHEETSPSAPKLLINKLVCSLVGKTQAIKIVPGSLVHRAYGKEEATEQFACSYGLNPKFREQLENGRLQITGVDLDGEARVVEAAGHPFFAATLFLPQASSEPENPHPLLVAFLRAARSFQDSEKCDKQHHDVS